MIKQYFLGVLSGLILGCFIDYFFKGKKIPFQKEKENKSEISLAKDEKLQHP